MIDFERKHNTARAECRRGKLRRWQRSGFTLAWGTSRRRANTYVQKHVSSLLLRLLLLELPNFFGARETRWIDKCGMHVYDAARPLLLPGEQRMYRGHGLRSRMVQAPLRSTITTTIGWNSMPTDQARNMSLFAATANGGEPSTTLSTWSKGWI